MKRIKKATTYALIVLLISILGMVIMMMINPLRSSEEQIRKNMLELTPIGMSMDDVIKVIQSNDKWEIEWINNEYGYGIDNSGTPGENRDMRIGEKSIRIHLGEYRTLFVTDVLVYYGFDTDSKLIEISVRKDTDSL